MAESLGPATSDSSEPPPNYTARFFVICILGAEVVGWLFFTSDLMRAVLVALVLAPCCLFWLIGSRLTVPKILLQTNAGILIGFMIYAALGAYGTTAGFANRNGIYYILADFFHWYGEGLLVAAMTVALLQGMSNRQLMGLISLAGLVLGLVALGAAVAGTLGVNLPGGHLIPNLRIWRLEAGRGFPTVHLVFVTAILMKGRPEGSVKITAQLAFIVLLAVLFVTFKRSQWLTYLCLFGWVLGPTRWQGIIRVAGIFLAAFFVTLMMAVPGGFEKGKDQVLELLTYNPSYKTEDTLEGRATQVNAVMPWVWNRPSGYGFGAKIYVYTPSVKDVSATHYVHNGFLYYAVQLGVPGTIIGLTLIALLLIGLWMRFGVERQWDWLVYGSFASVVTTLVISLALVCFHTPYFGFAVGTAVVAINKVRLGGQAITASGAARHRWSESAAL